MCSTVPLLAVTVGAAKPIFFRSQSANPFVVSARAVDFSRGVLELLAGPTNNEMASASPLFSFYRV